MADNHHIEQVASALKSVIRGKDDVIEKLLVGLCAGGHVLVEDVPGVGKTTLARALAVCVKARFRRIQFTPDLLPTDILGGMVYSPNTGDFTFRPGPIFSHVLLADEINRASPRTQSALLEAMNEGQVSVEGDSHVLESPFIVIATQNPVEYHGTYPLPEAQLDRFALRLTMGYPLQDEEMEIVQGQRISHPLDALEPIITPAEVVEVQHATRDVVVAEDILRYITDLVRATRQESRVRLGASPRASNTLYRCAQALAFVRGRNYTLPDDVKDLAVGVLAHRLVLDTKTQYAGTTNEDMVEDILAATPVPV